MRIWISLLALALPPAQPLVPKETWTGGQKLHAQESFYREHRALLTLRRRNQLSLSALEKGSPSRGTGPLCLESRPAREELPPLSQGRRKRMKGSCSPQEKGSIHPKGCGSTLISGCRTWHSHPEVPAVPCSHPTPPTPFTECTEFYGALQSQTHTRQTQPLQHLGGFASTT